MSTGVATAEQLSAQPADSLDKIVILLLALEEDRVTGLLDHFSEEEINFIKTAAERLGPITPQQLSSVVDEFEAELRSDENQTRDPKQVYDLIQSATGAGLDDDNDAPNPALTWNEVIQAEVEIMFECLEKEHPQVCAYVLSRLDPQTASALVLKFEEAGRTEVMRRMMAMKTVDESVANAIGSAIASKLNLGDAEEGASANRQSVADMLNRMEADEREELLAQLEEIAPLEVALLKALLFSFEDIPKLDEGSRKVLFDTVSSDLLVPALQGCDDAFKELVLDCLGARAKRMVEAELSSGRDVPEDVIKQARISIASSALSLASDEKISLPSSGEEAE